MQRGQDHSQGSLTSCNCTSEVVPLLMLPQTALGTCQIHIIYLKTVPCGPKLHVGEDMNRLSHIFHHISSTFLSDTGKTQSIRSANNSSTFSETPRPNGKKHQSVLWTTSCFSMTVAKPCPSCIISGNTKVWFQSPQRISCYLNLILDVGVTVKPWQVLWSEVFFQSRASWLRKHPPNPSYFPTWGPGCSWRVVKLPGTSGCCPLQRQGCVSAPDHPQWEAEKRTAALASASLCWLTPVSFLYLQLPQPVSTGTQNLL